MEKTRLFILLLAGLATVSAHHSRQYEYVHLTKSWAEAQSYCREKFTDLATVDNDYDNKILLTVAENIQPGSYAWIGLYDDKNSWKWSMEDEDFYGDGEAEFRSWLKGQPNNYGGKQYCVSYTSMKWNDLECDTLSDFVCYDAKATIIYILVTTKMKWLDAQTYCRMHHTDLISIRNQEENEEMQRHLLQSQIEKAWIGLYRDPWAFWSDSSTSTFSNWELNEPNNNINKQYCAAVDAITGKWADQYCESKRPFFCNTKKITKQMTIKIRFQSTADMKSKEIQRQITEQLQAQMESKGLTDFKIHWKSGESLHEHHEDENNG